MNLKEIPFDLLRENFGNVKDTRYDYVVLPWGATEPHNYHLPYLTDCYIAFDIAREAVSKAFHRHQVRGMVLPPLYLGSQNPGQKELPFCIHARYETQQMILRDIVESLRCQGQRKLIILNGHGGNSFKQMIRDFASDYPDMLIVCSEWFTVESRMGYFEAETDDHAGEQETSIMLHYRPWLVHLDSAGKGESVAFGIESLNRKVGWVPRDWLKATRDTGVGNPAKATALKGERYVQVVTDKIATLFYELVTQSLYN